MTLLELKKLAQSATPGPWIMQPIKHALGESQVSQKPQSDAKFIAAMNPSTALRMIELLARAKPMIQNLEECGCNRIVDSEMAKWLKDLEEIGK